MSSVSPTSAQNKFLKGISLNPSEQLTLTTALGITAYNPASVAITGGTAALATLSTTGSVTSSGNVVLNTNTGVLLFGSAGDLSLQRGGANIIEQRNGVLAQSSRVFNTWATAGADYERGVTQWTANVFQVGTEFGGSGTALRQTALGGNTVVIQPSGLGVSTGAANFAANGNLTLGGKLATPNWTEGINIATPNATIPVVQWLAASATATDVDIAITPKGGGAFTLQSADNTTVGGNKRGVGAVDLQLSRTSNTQVASGAGSFAAGVRNVASGANGTALGNTCVASGSTTLAVGSNCSATATGAVALGQGTLADGVTAVALGNSSTTRTLRGVFAMSPAPFTTAGDNQRMTVMLRTSTTNATPTELFVDGAAQRIVPPVNFVYSFEGRIQARNAANGDYAVWTVAGVISKGASNATTALGAAITPVLIASTGTGATWSVALTADTSNGSLDITATGAASTNLHWNAVLSTLELQ